MGLARRRGWGTGGNTKVVLALLSCTQRCVDRLGREEEHFKEGCGRGWWPGAPGGGDPVIELEGHAA